MKLDLSGLNTRKLAALGDGLLRAGMSALAELMYRKILDVAPSAAHVWSRFGMARAPGFNSFVMLDALQVIEKSALNCFAAPGLLTWDKSLPFLDDKRFMDLVDRHSELLPIPNWHWSLNTVIWAVQQVKDLDGDFLELGVFKGHTTLIVSEYVKFSEWKKNWILFDTFDGIPDDQVDPGWEKSNTSAYKGTYSYEEVCERFAHIDNVHVIQGVVPEILIDNVPDRIAFIHMDLNNATAEIAALDFLFDRLVSGGIIIFDDFAWTVARKQYEAEKIWFESRDLRILALPTGQGLFVKR
jgi:hypothetical protein